MKNQIERLHRNIKTLNQLEILDDEFEVFAKEMPECDSIEELNVSIENELFYIAQDAELEG